MLLVRKSQLAGRGQVTSSREVPDYMGVLGYAVVSSDQDLKYNLSFSATPWTIPVYREDKQFWEEAGTIDHKTEVVVIGQKIEKPSRIYSSSTLCPGYVHVIRLDTCKDCWLDVGNFMTNAYWEKSLKEALEEGYCIAVFNQVSDYYPVNRNGSKTELEDGTLVLVPEKFGIYASSPDKTNNPLAAIIFQKLSAGYDGVEVFFNEKDLKLTY